MKITVATLAARIDAMDARQDAADKLAAENHAQIIALLSGGAAAVVTPPVVEVEVAPVSKAPEGKVFRSAKGKAAAKVAVDKAWADAKDKAGVKRVKDLTPKQRAAVDAQVKAIWAAVPKTRSTKA